MLWHCTECCEGYSCTSIHPWRPERWGASLSCHSDGNHPAFPFLLRPFISLLTLLDVLALAPRPPDVKHALFPRVRFPGCPMGHPPSPVCRGPRQRGRAVGSRSLQRPPGPLSFPGRGRLCQPARAAASLGALVLGCDLAVSGAPSPREGRTSSQAASQSGPPRPPVHQHRSRRTAGGAEQSSLCCLFLFLLFVFFCLSSKEKEAWENSKRCFSWRIAEWYS